MRSAAALALLAAGAILTFAVSARVPGISLRLTGVIIMLTAVASTLLPPSPAIGWLRRRGHPEPPAAAPDATPASLDADYPAYLLQDPAVLAAEVLNGIRAESWSANRQPEDPWAEGRWTESRRPEDRRPEYRRTGDGPDDWRVSDRRAGDQRPHERWAEERWAEDRWPQPAATRTDGRPRRPAGERPLRSVRFDREDGVG